ncbi:MAG: hypothetical protein HKL90_02425 [Elusimicrobia bacterium]|nr:hypothetical protein [Elusimicrobiota bacterium]
MTIFSAVGVALGAVLFFFAPEGVNAMSVGSMVLLVASIGGFFLAQSQWNREDLEPFAKDLGLDLREVVAMGDSMRAEFRGDFLGRPVMMRIQRLLPSSPFGYRTNDPSYLVSISVPCANARGTHLRIVPVLPGIDRMLEILPPKLDGDRPWAAGFEVRGEPAEDAVGLIARVAPERWGVLESRGRWGDFLKLLGNECSFEMTLPRSPSSAETRSRLELCVCLAHAAE